MDKHLLLSLVILSSLLSFLQALRCFHCERFNSNGVCERGEKICQAKKFQRCYVRKVYEDNVTSYGSQGCSSICSSSKVSNENVAVELRCCDDSSLCNKF